MAIARLLLLSLLLTLILGKTTADAEISDDESLKSELSQSSVEIELEQLKSKISSLGTRPLYLLVLLCLVAVISREIRKFKNLADLGEMFS